MLLLIAGCLKAEELASTPVVAEGSSRLLLIVLVELELALGAWLALRLFKPRAARNVALALFVCFAGISLNKALRGEASCGCLGKAPLSPWYSLSVDITAVAGLAWWRPSTSVVLLLPTLWSKVILWTQKLGWPLGILGFLIIAVRTGIAMTYHQPFNFGFGSIFAATVDPVIQPAKWGGKRLPLLPYIDIGEELSRGKWLIILYRLDCPDCKKTIAAYEKLASSLKGVPGAPRVALIEVPPYDNAPLPLPSVGSPCRLGKLKDTKDWRTSLPVVVAVQNGLVLRLGEQFATN